MYAFFENGDPNHIIDINVDNDKLHRITNTTPVRASSKTIRMPGTGHENRAMKSPYTSDRQRIQPRAAFKALRELIDNPERTEKAFEVIRALSGQSLARSYRRFVKTESGRRILAKELNLIDTLRDREHLRALPAGSFGRAYYDFVYGESLSADELVQASAVADDEAEGIFDQDFARFGERVRDQHDLWHTLTRYGRDELGELCLLAFTYAQTRNRGVGLIVLAGMFQFREFFGNRIFGIVWGAFQDGRRASWLPAEEWEELLPLPIADVRRLLAIPAPDTYRTAKLEYLAATA